MTTHLERLFRPSRPLNSQQFQYLPVVHSTESDITWLSSPNTFFPCCLIESSEGTLVFYLLVGSLFVLYCRFCFLRIFPICKYSLCELSSASSSSANSNQSRQGGGGFSVSVSVMSCSKFYEHGNCKSMHKFAAFRNVLLHGSRTLRVGKLSLNCLFAGRNNN